MATKRPRMTLNVPIGVWRWFRRIEIRGQVSKTRLVVAGIAALRSLGDEERDAMIQWAVLLDRGGATWEDYEKACEGTARDRARALKAAVERALEHELEGFQRSRTGRKSEVGEARA